MNKITEIIAASSGGVVLGSLLGELYGHEALIIAGILIIIVCLVYRG